MTTTARKASMLYICSSSPQWALQLPWLFQFRIFSQPFCKGHSVITLTYTWSVDILFSSFHRRICIYPWRTKRLSSAANKVGILYMYTPRFVSGVLSRMFVPGGAHTELNGTVLSFNCGRSSGFSEVYFYFLRIFATSFVLLKFRRRNMKHQPNCDVGFGSLGVLD
ncbi:hypothetical protein R3P38DRAFT_2981501 [Favolaschia claudopus]|uniref:Uncharacterized protein n=1 Tax=Favolaschia claudopus TaxID=2862362 RepID=A0AAW0AWZ2_9AGAR